MDGRNQLAMFIVDLVNTITERKADTDSEYEESKDDFKSGRHLAYFEVMDMIESRLNIYDIDLEHIFPLCPACRCKARRK